MAIVNRDNAQGQQMEQVTAKVAATAAAATYMLWQAPFPCEVREISQSANGLSGAPFHFIDIYRMAAAGLTTITGLHASLGVVAVGTSGPQGFSVIAPGSTLIQLQAKDILVLRTAVANTAVTDVAISLVVKKLQDIVSYYGRQS